MAPWRSGYAEVCKTSYTGSIPVGASILQPGRVAELVYAADLKSAGLNNLVGSSPTSPTIVKRARNRARFILAIFLPEEQTQTAQCETKQNDAHKCAS